MSHKLWLFMNQMPELKVMPETLNYPRLNSAWIYDWFFLCLNGVWWKPWLFRSWSCDAVRPNRQRIWVLVNSQEIFEGRSIGWEMCLGLVKNRVIELCWVCWGVSSLGNLLKIPKNLNKWTWPWWIWTSREFSRAHRVSMVDIGEFAVFWGHIGAIWGHCALWGFSWEGSRLTKVWPLIGWVSNLCLVLRVLLKVRFRGEMMYFEMWGKNGNFITLLCLNMRMLMNVEKSWKKMGFIAPNLRSFEG